MRRLPNCTIRADESEALWFESDSCYVFHTANAWEEKDSEGRTEVVLVACRSDTVRLEGFSDTDGVSPSQAAAKMVVCSFACLL